jgi:heavy metal translocating P-type ATPase
MSAEERCSLCGRPVTGAPFVRTVAGAERLFDTADCATIYTAAVEAGVDPKTLESPAPSPRLRDQLTGAGRTAYFAVDGMWCATCGDSAGRILANQPGVISADISFQASRGRMRYDPAVTTPEDALAILVPLGYEGRVLEDARGDHAERQQEATLLRLLVAIGFGMQIELLYFELLYPVYARGGVPGPQTRLVEYIAWALATPVLFYGGSSFVRGAWEAAKARTADMNTLVAIASIAAYTYSAYMTVTGQGPVFFDSVATITMFVMFGRYLESVGMVRAGRDIERLMTLQPAVARRRTGEEWAEVPSAEVAVDDVILVRPGERVPADAVVLEGEAAVDESLLTGEVEPVTKAPGATLYAGTVVADDAVQARVTHPEGMTRLSQISALVEETMMAQPPVQRMADRASAYFTYAMLATAVVTLAGWMLAGRALPAAFLAAVAVLVVACPCALGMATPLAIMAALGRAASAGVVVRDPAALEQGARVRRVAFDKTGTLTQGRLSVVEARPAVWVGSAEDLLCAAGAVEQYSEHPLAKAIVAACGHAPASSAFSSVRGMGVSAEVGDVHVAVGTRAFAGEGAESELVQVADEAATLGDTVVWVSAGGRVAGFVRLRDELDAEAAEAVARLGGAGVTAVVLSGDTPAATRTIAGRIGIREWEGALTPEDKVSRIRAWKDGGQVVAMVGDGVNDAPALAVADVSLTVAGGTDIAGGTSAVLLVRDRLELVPWFLSLASATQRVIRQNIWWAVGYNLVTVPAAALGFISPVWAALGMAASSLLVVLNSARLRRVRLSVDLGAAVPAEPAGAHAAEATAV